MRASRLDSSHRQSSRSDPDVNVGSIERFASSLVGVTLITAGLARRNLGGLAAAIGGAALIKRGVSGHCGVYERLGVNRADGHRAARPHDYFERGIHVEESVTIERPLHEVFEFWRNLENLPRFMGHVKQVRVLDGQRSHWTVKGPAGEIEWDAEIINLEPYRLISWKTLPGAEVDNAGTVVFRGAAGGRATRLRVVLDYLPPTGRAGLDIARLMGESPDAQISDDLRRLREILEARKAPKTRTASDRLPKPPGRAAATRGRAESDQLQVQRFESEGGHTAPASGRERNHLTSEAEGAE
jgi:uncharacterized membrane protein